MTGMVCRDLSFVHIMKTILNFDVKFQKENNKKFFASCIADIEKDILAFDLLTGIYARSYHRYFRVAKVILRHGSVFPLGANLNDSVTVSESMGISSFDNIALYTASKKELPITIREASIFCEEHKYTSSLPHTCVQNQHIDISKRAKGFVCRSPCRIWSEICCHSELVYVPYT